jgi:hypothetical protein
MQWLCCKRSVPDVMDYSDFIRYSACVMKSEQLYMLRVSVI